MLRLLVFKLVLLCFVKSGMMATSSYNDYWHEMDPNYDMSYLDPVGEMFADTVIGCALLGLRENVTAFGYQTSGRRCHLYNVDYYLDHIWDAYPGFQYYLRNEDIYTGDCLDYQCGFCMPILETEMTWDDAKNACENLLEYGFAYLLEITDDVMHRCMAMQLQYLRKPTNTYWVGAKFDPDFSDWVWSWHESLGVGEVGLWENGEPDNPATEECVLLTPGGNYTLRSADCSEKHYALCEYYFEA